MRLLCVILGAAVGAPLRYLIDRKIQSLHETRFPWGTVGVNASASLLIGIVTGAATAGVASAEVQLTLGVGFCATLSTYSTFSYESVRLAEQGARFLAAANIAVSVLVGVGAAFLGVAIAHAIWL